MNRFSWVVLVLVGCGQAAVLPDGGRPRQVCQSSGTVIAVTASDLMGQPLTGATVTAVNSTTGAKVTGTTGGDGRTTALTDNQLGGGQISITALADQNGTQVRTRRPFVVEITCGECDCTAQPHSASLTLE